MFETLLANGYLRRFIKHIANRRDRRSQRDCIGLACDDVSQGEDRWISVPYVQGMSEATAMVLHPLGIRIAHCASRWKWSVCPGIKDVIPSDKKNGVVYKVPCQDCQAVYVGETLRTLPTRLQEHQRHTRKGEMQHSAIAEHACGLQHQINWHGAGVIDRELDWRSRKMKEALHICV